MRRMIAAGVLLVALAGCDGGGGGSADATTGGSTDITQVQEPPANAEPEVPDAPDLPDGPGEASPEKPAARPPINIPEYLQRGIPLNDDVRQYIDSQWIEACGDGTVCVTLEFEPADGSLEAGECKIVAPYPSGTVERDGTVTYVLDRPCA